MHRSVEVSIDIAEEMQATLTSDADLPALVLAAHRRRDPTKARADGYVDGRKHKGEPRSQSAGSGAVRTDEENERGGQIPREYARRRKQGMSRAPQEEEAAGLMCVLI